MYTNIVQHHLKLKHYHKHPSCMYITLMYQIPHSIRVQIYAPVKWKLGFISWSWDCSSLLFIVVKPVHISKPLCRGNCRFQGVRILVFTHSGILAYTFIIEFHLSFLFYFVFWFFCPWEHEIPDSRIHKGLKNFREINFAPTESLMNPFYTHIPEFFLFNNLY